MQRNTNKFTFTHTTKLPETKEERFEFALAILQNKKWQGEDILNLVSSSTKATLGEEKVLLWLLKNAEYYFQTADEKGHALAKHYKTIIHTIRTCLKNGLLKLDQVNELKTKDGVETKMLSIKITKYKNQYAFERAKQFEGQLEILKDAFLKLEQAEAKKTTDAKVTPPLVAYDPKLLAAKSGDKPKPSSKVRLHR